MNSFQDQLQSGLDRRIEPIDPEHFVREKHLSAWDVPGETAGVAQSLSFGQIGFASRELGLRLLALGQVEDERHPLFARAFESCAVNNDSDALAVLADEFLLEGLASPGLPYLFNRARVSGAIFRRRHA